MCGETCDEPRSPGGGEGRKAEVGAKGAASARRKGGDGPTPGAPTGRSSRALRSATTSQTRLICLLPSPLSRGDKSPRSLVCSSGGGRDWISEGSSKGGVSSVRGLYHHGFETFWVRDPYGSGKFHLVRVQTQGASARTFLETIKGEQLLLSL